MLNKDALQIVGVHQEHDAVFPAGKWMHDEYFHDGQIDVPQLAEEEIDTKDHQYILLWYGPSGEQNPAHPS